MANYIDEFGVEFSEDRKTLIKCPANLGGGYIIPQGIEIIGYQAFAYSKVTHITVCNSVKKIDGHAFSGCAELTSISLPESIEEIGPYAFSGCNRVIVVTIESRRITRIGEDLFIGCDALRRMYVPKGERERLLQIGLASYSNMIIESN